ncbi:MAG: MATE family efflux transporter [Prevotella histicola]|jgi:MATE efflux family protein|uniref:MATE family efflux transporter n=1 Tax=Prevotella histicola TaxID=470565 RepID=UPI00241BECE1|nr:MATE family efflux transporter [Prevotella histicola]MBS5897538.1 MATE family efflux transporter [Prevotella histicola]
MMLNNSKNREILRLAIPSIISNVTVPLLGLVDLSIVGHIGNEDYISAIAVGSMIFNVMYWLLGFLRMGTSGMTSQAFGREDTMECIRILVRSLTIGLAFGLLFILTQSGLEWGLLRLMNTPEASWEYVTTYFQIVIWGAPAMLGLYSLTGWFIGMQDTRTPMVVAILQNLVNILASLSLVFVLGWGIAGVAAGTLLAQWIGFLVALLGAWKRLHKVNCLRIGQGLGTDSWSRLVRVLFVKAAWINFFLVNKDIFLRTLCLIVVNFYFTSAGGKQGAMMLAVNTLLMTLFTIFSYVMDGFAYAGEALSGKYYGAGDKQGLHVTVRNLFQFGFLMAVVFTGLYMIGGTGFLHLLTDDDAVVEAARPYLPWACFIPVVGVTAFILDGVFIGLTDTKGMLFSTVMAMVLFFIVYFVFRDWLANYALWLAFLSFLLMRGAASMLWMRFFSTIDV